MTVRFLLSLPLQLRTNLLKTQHRTFEVLHNLFRQQQTQLPWPNLFIHFRMENTRSIYVEQRHEHWEMPDALALKWEQYETENPLAPDGSNADERHLAWFETLTPQEQALVSRRKAED